MNLIMATSMLSRLKGLLCKQPDESVLVLAPCCDVHTFGMKHELDIAFVDKCGVVVKSCICVGPNKRLKARNAVAVLERFSEENYLPWFEEGDRISLEKLKQETLK